MAMNNSNQNRKNFLTFFKAEDTPGTVLLALARCGKIAREKKRLSAKAAPNTI
jgi:hypothetical protein